MDETTDLARALVMSRVAVAAGVRNLVGDRIRPGVLAVNEQRPALSYKLLSSTPLYDLDGDSGDGFSRVTITAHGDTYDDAVAAATAVSDCLSGGAFDITAGDELLAVVGDCTIENEYDAMDPPAAGSSAWRYRRVVDFAVSHSRPLPTLELELTDTPEDP